MSHKQNTFIRKLTRTGKYTYYLVVPKEIVDELHWRERQKLEIKKYGEGFIVRDWKKKGKRSTRKAERKK